MIEHSDIENVSLISIGEQFILAKSYNTSQLLSISERFGIWHDYHHFIGSVENHVKTRGWHSVVGEMIKIDFQLGGDGLGYAKGVEFHFFDASMEKNTMVTTLSETTLQQYALEGKNALFTGYQGHHINNKANYPEMKYDPDNLVLVNNTTHDLIENNPTLLPKVNNTGKVKRSFDRGNFGQFALGMLLTGVFGFLFGFLAHFVSVYIYQKKRIPNYWDSERMAELAKQSAFVGLTSMGFALIINILGYLGILLVFTVSKISFDETGIQFLFIGIYALYGIVGVLINSAIKRESPVINLFVVAGFSLITIVVSLPTVFFTGVSKLIGWMICYGVSIFIRLNAMKKSDLKIQESR